MNKIKIYGRSFKDLNKINTGEDFHNYLIEHAIKEYQKMIGEEKLGSILAVCANQREAVCFKKFPFSKIVISGIMDQNKEINNVAGDDKRISYQKQQCENIDIPSESFDLVFCKEGLHHLARPISGLYEMLRICKKAVIIIEPYDTTLGRLFEKLGISSTYENDQEGNINSRPNYVYRFSKRQLEMILNSYYLNSGYRLYIHLGWLSTKLNMHRSKLVRKLAVFLGWIAGFILTSRGNYMTSIIIPGKDLPTEIDKIKGSKDEE